MEATTTRPRQQDEAQCECGDITGVRCEWSGPEADTVVVEWMPWWIRASHKKAGNRGRYPMNGAQRTRMAEECAKRIVQTAALVGWAEQVAT